MLEQIWYVTYAVWCFLLPILFRFKIFFSWSHKILVFSSSNARRSKRAGGATNFAIHPRAACAATYLTVSKPAG